MFKTIHYFNISPLWVSDLQSIENAVGVARFVDCGASQERSLGWTEPRGEKHGPLVESVGGQWVLKLMIEGKVLPGSVVKEAVAKRVEQLEQQAGRKPGSKEKRQIREDVRASLLIKAFTKKSTALVWIDQSARRLVVEAGSQSKADEIVSTLVNCLEGFAVMPVNTAESPAVCMSRWLVSQELPSGFSADRDCVLKATDDSNASVRYAKHALDIEEVRAHIASGKIPTELAMTWDSRLSFVLTNAGALKKIEFLDVVFENNSSAQGDAGFDTDVAIATGEFRKLLPDLILALGGEAAFAEAAKLPEGLSSVTMVTPGAAHGEPDAPDPLYEQAVSVVEASGKPSISLVQRHLQIGYNRAARLIEAMEYNGLVGPADVGGVRHILNRREVAAEV